MSNEVVVYEGKEVICLEETNKIDYSNSNIGYGYVIDRDVHRKDIYAGSDNLLTGLILGGIIGWLI